MLYATVNGQKCRPQATGDRGTCPGCGQPVIAKCGEIVTHHWAHKSADCDPWSEGETPWHLGWKENVPAEQCEVVIGNHRADIQLTSGLVVELQHSSISPQEIREREEFYGNMVWLFDARDWGHWMAGSRWPNITFSPFASNAEKFPATNVYRFHWKWPRKSLWACSRPVLLDIGSSIFRIENIRRKHPCHGWGVVWAPQKFVQWMQAGGSS